MRFIQKIGCALFILSIICAWLLAGKIETEEADYKAGEITQSEMTSDEQLWKDVGAIIGIAISGGVVYAVGGAVELAQEKRRARERWFDEDE